MGLLEQTGGRLTAAAARRLLSWSAGRANPSDRAWIEAIRGELEVVEEGPAQLFWALGGLSLLAGARRRTVTRTWYSWPALLRSSSFGLVLSVVLVVGIVWSNVIVPSNESDDEYTAWYLAFYIGLFAYFTLAGAVAGGWPNRVASSALAGALTAILVVVVVLVTFMVIDNLFLDVVMQQPDKANGFRNSGMTSRRDYVNQGNFAIFFVVPVVGALGAAFGVLGGLIRERIGTLRARPGPAQ
jgi:hypothetical protein